jgi:hypothetical protein
MRRIATLTAMAALAGAGPAFGAEVELMVVGKDRVLRAPAEVQLKERTVKVGGRRCRVGAATPLSALAATNLRLAIRDYGRCGRDWRDAAGLYVRSVAGQRASGQAGWVYKVGRKVGTTGAGDPRGPFGTGRRLRDGQRVTWFWCVRANACQRTLEVRADRSSAAPGETLRATVRGYDDFGRGVPVAGATLRLGPATSVTAGDGTAVLAVPDAAGRLALTAERARMVPAFPAEIRVG